MNKNKKILNYVIFYCCYLFIVWGLYRLAYDLNDVLEEFVIKPVIWLAPIAYILRKEKKGLKSLGVTGKNMMPGIYLVLALGVGFALEGLLLNVLKYGGPDFAANVGNYAFSLSFLISLVTATTEEVSFRGFIFGRLLRSTKNEWAANLASSFFWGLIHLPIAYTRWGVGGSATVLYFVLVVIFGFGSAFIYARTKNIFPSILLHVFWSWPIILFR